MKVIRLILGYIILLVDYVTRPKPIIRDKSLQKKINNKTLNMCLYQFKLCPFCVKVRRNIRKYSLNIEIKDAKNNKRNREDLDKIGGKLKVPCLRIKNKENDLWLYESKDIINFLINNLKLENK